MQKTFVTRAVYATLVLLQNYNIHNSAALHECWGRLTRIHISFKLELKWYYDEAGAQSSVAGLPWQHIDLGVRRRSEVLSTSNSEVQIASPKKKAVSNLDQRRGLFIQALPGMARVRLKGEPGGCTA
jgi:hypothetical protein